MVQANWPRDPGLVQTDAKRTGASPPDGDMVRKIGGVSGSKLDARSACKGFDSCPLEGFDSRRVKKILGLPHRAVVVMAVAAGKRDPERVYGPRLRFDRELFIREI